ncbi:MAG TPA: PglZ domain-containing protein [Streptosporangiaceae bacterium]|nr:PglZ domain-containing protein [Streptosporangiaceae bacterium]
MGRQAVSRLRDHLAHELAAKVQARGLVIWDDTAAEYQQVAAALAPDDVRFEAFAGSWFELRRRIEDAIGGEEPPKLIVYGPGPPPAEDPLAETRSAGTVFTRRLSTLVTQAMVGQMAEARIKQVASRARTLEEAEAAIAGNGDADVRLIALLGSRDVERMLTTVLAAAKDEQIGAAGMWPAVAELCRLGTGAIVDGAADVLRDGLFRHLLLSDIAAACGSLPEDLATAWHRPARPEMEHISQILQRLRATPEGSEAYRGLSDRADAALALGDTLDWQPGLERAAGTRATETAVLRHALRQLSADPDTALAIAERRLTQCAWVPDPASGWGSRWRAVHAVARLRAELARSPVPASPSGMLSWYAESGCQVDRAHRRLELARTGLGVFGELEDALTAARAAYDSWLDAVLDRFTSGLEQRALDAADLVRQAEIHDRFVAGAAQRTAYVWVDALRYELGLDLAEALKAVAADVTVHPAVAVAPTITPVGMAGLLPGAAEQLRVGLNGDKITVTMGGTEVRDVAGRRDLLRDRHGTVADLDLNDAAQKGEKALSHAIGNAGLVLLRSQEVDASGESGMLSVAWSRFETVVGLLASVIARLSQVGVERFVISADHGFIALGQDVGAQRVVDPPSGAAGSLKRRVFVGRGGVPDPATVRVALADCGVTSDLDIVVPRGLAVFRAGGGRQFVHGGLSPQELVVPVLVVNVAKSPRPQRLGVRVQVAGERVTTGVFAATLGFAGDMFTDEVTVRVVAAGRSGTPVARIVSGDGYDPERGTISVAADRASVLTFQVTVNLATGSQLDLQVLDARTGVKVGSSSVAVAAPIVVEDALD